MASGREPYVRLAEPHEYPEVANILTRAFARDPSMNWFACVRPEGFVPSYKDAPDYATHSEAAKQTMRNLHTFQRALVYSTAMLGGVITVAVIPNDSDKNDGSETIAGASLWLKPGQTMDFPVTVIIRSGMWKILFGFGFTGLKRLLFDFGNSVENALLKSFKARGLDRMDSWHFLEVVVDPPHAGKGLASLMAADGHKRASPKPIHLEATTPRNKDIYAHWGYEVDELHYYGKGVVDKNGLAAKGDAATGFPESIMTKWTT